MSNMSWSSPVKDRAVVHYVDLPVYGAQKALRLRLKLRTSGDHEGLP